MPRLTVLAAALVLATPAATARAEVPAELLTLDHWLVQLRCREPAAFADRMACYQVAGRMLAAATRAAGEVEERRRRWPAAPGAAQARDA